MTNGKVIIEPHGPTTQSIESVKALLMYLNKPSDPLPETIVLANGAVLTLSSKRDVYYVTTPRACSCPSASFRPGQACKHIPAKREEVAKPANMAEVLAEHDRNLPRMPASYQRMVKAVREGGEDLELIPRSKFAPTLEAAMAGERSMLGDAPGRIDLSEPVVVDTDRAAQRWEEASDWDGRNHISRATGSQWTHQTLYRSSKGRYYIVHSSQWQGTRDHAEEVTKRAAAEWLVLNDHVLPEDLAGLEGEVVE